MEAAVWVAMIAAVEQGLTESEALVIVAAITSVCTLIGVFVTGFFQIISTRRAQRIEQKVNENTEKIEAQREEVRQMYDTSNRLNEKLRLVQEQMNRKWDQFGEAEVAKRGVLDHMRETLEDTNRRIRDRA